MSGILKLRQTLIKLLTEAASKARQQGKLPAVALPEVLIEHPRYAEHGDYATSLALKLARATGLAPLAIAKNIVGLITPPPEISQIAVAPPGFINFILKDNWLAGQVEEILAAGDAYGSIDMGRGSWVQVEFVSVNPTGPLHVGHGRGGVLGSTLANVLASAGYKVETEYYLNDAGSQIDAFQRTLYARYQQGLGTDAEMPADGYRGSYIIDLASEIIAEEKDRFLKLPEAEAVPALGRVGLAKMMTQIKAALEQLGVKFDVWFSEQSLYEKGQYDKAMALLRQGGYISEREGAVWFGSTALGEDKDSVVVRGDGSPTYFASDIAYHYNKFLERNFDKVINIWGADHQGHISRMKAVVGAWALALSGLR